MFNKIIYVIWNSKKNIERFRLETIVKAVEEVTTDFYIMDALSDYLELLRDFSGCIENIQKDCYVTEGKQPEDVLQELKGSARHWKQ